MTKQQLQTVQLVVGGRSLFSCCLHCTPLLSVCLRCKLWQPLCFCSGPIELVSSRCVYDLLCDACTPHATTLACHHSNTSHQPCAQSIRPNWTVQGHVISARLQAAGDESWEALLMQTLVPASASAANASAAQDGSSFCSQLLSHLQHMEQASESVAATPDAAAHNTGIQDRAAQALTARKVLRELLWARAAHHFERRNFQSARLFYQVVSTEIWACSRHRGQPCCPAS